MNETYRNSADDEARALTCLRLAAARGLSAPALEAFGRGVQTGPGKRDPARIDWCEIRRALETLLRG